MFDPSAVTGTAAVISPTHSKASSRSRNHVRITRAHYKQGNCPEHDSVGQTCGRVQGLPHATLLRTLMVSLKVLETYRYMRIQPCWELAWTA